MRYDEPMNFGNRLSGVGPASADRLCGAHVVTGIGDPVELARQACLGGAGVVQYREKTGPRGPMLAVARELRAVTRAGGALLIVNDWLDIALLCGADGVHLGQDDIPLAEARRLAPPGFLIGISTRSLAQARAAADGGADYLGLGPVFATPIKEEEPVGLEVLQTVARAVRVPVVAIGGITVENMALVRAAGAAAVAMVRGFALDTAAVVRQTNECFAAG
jgi:thiamine-phosphate pyrophosphorylase